MSYFILLGQNRTKFRNIGGVLSEKCKDTTNIFCYTNDNQIYKIGNKFYFSCVYIDTNNQTYFCDRTLNEWKLIAENKEFDSTKIFIVLFAEPDAGQIRALSPPNYHQTLMAYEYKTIENKHSDFGEWTGVIENKKNIWLHPPRTKLFKILELNPFPYVQKPLKKGNTWEWELRIGKMWGDIRWKTWDGLITNKYHYRITDTKIILNTELGDLQCYRIESYAQSELGRTELISYFNNIYGFVRLEYVNIDKSRIILTLIKFE
jgi:hypothetical protein